jgi:hypothetical protein
MRAVACYRTPELLNERVRRIIEEADVDSVSVCSGCRRVIQHAGMPRSDLHANTGIIHLKTWTCNIHQTMASAWSQTTGPQMPLV